MKDMMINFMAVMAFSLQSWHAFADQSLSCDKQQTYCLVLKSDLTVGDKVAFLYLGKLSAVGLVSEIYYNGQRRIDVTKKYSTIYKNVEIKLIHDNDGSDLYAAATEPGVSDAVLDSMTKQYGVVKSLQTYSMGISGGIASYQVRNSINGFEATGFVERRLWKSLKASGQVSYSYAEGDINRNSYDAFGYDYGNFKMHYATVMPGVSATAFEDSAVSFKLSGAAGLGFTSAAIDEDADLLSDVEYNTGLKNGASFAARATASILIDISIAKLELYGAGNSLQGSSYLSLGAGLSRDF